MDGFVNLSTLRRKDGRKEHRSESVGRISGDFCEVAPRNESRRELFAIQNEAGSKCRLSAKCCRIGPKHERNFCVRFGSRKPRMRRSRSRVGWWLFSAQLFSRAAALTNTCFTFASSGISAFAAG